MVRKAILAFAAFFLLLSATFAADSLESPSVELLSGNEDLRSCISILDKAKEEEGLTAVDQLSLYYFLKADGEREKAILAALKGLDAWPQSPAAPMLADIVEDEMTYSALTEKIAAEVISSALRSGGDDPLLRFRLLRSLFVMASRKGDAQGVDRILDRMGIPPAAFFEAPDDELPRTKFRQASFSAPKGELTRFPRDHQFLYAPSSLLAVKGEYLGRMHIPFQTEEGEYWLLITTRSPMKLGVDGTTLFESDPFFGPQPPVTILKLSLRKGAHTLSAVFHSSNNNEGVSVSITPRREAGAPVTFPDRMDPAPGSAGCSLAGNYENSVEQSAVDGDHFSLAMNALLARAEGDYPRSRRLLEKAVAANPKYLLWKLILAELVIEKSYDLPESYALSRAESVVDDILGSNPSCPEAMFYKIYLKSNSSRGEEFLSELRKLTEDSPGDPRWFIQLARELDDLGWKIDARDLLLRSRSLFPQNSQVEEEWLGFCQARRNFPEQIEALEALAKLRVVPAEHESYCSSTGDYGCALKWLEKQQELFGDPSGYLEQGRIGYLEKLGRREEALSSADRLLARNPRNAGWAMIKARLLDLHGKSAEAAALLDQVKKADPSVFNVDYARWLAGGELPFEKERISLDEALSDNAGSPSGAPSSYLLDHQITRVFEDGSTLERYHGIVAVHDRDGVEREGEQQFPANHLLLLRTIKPDGRSVEPEIVPNKRTIGMSGLEAGDLIEYEYIALSGPNGIKKGSYYTPYVFMFQDMEKPFARTSWSIKYPPSFKMSFFEQNLPSPPVVTSEDGLVVRKYEYRSMPRLAYEPDLPFKNIYLPLADAVGNMDWKDYAKALQNEVTGSFPVSPEVSDKCAELTKGSASDADKASRIVGFVMSSIEGEGKGWGDPKETLLLGEGNRLQLAMAMLSAARVKFDLLFAEPVTQAQDKNDLPTEGKFQVPILRIYPGKSPADYFLESPYRDPAVLPWYLQGAEAIPATADEPWARVHLSRDWSRWEGCPQFEQRNFDSRGNLEIGFSQTLDPDQSAQLRGALRKLPKDRWKEVLQMAFAKQFGNVEITDYGFRNLDDNSRNLVMTASAKVAGYASSNGAVLRIEEPIDRLELMKNFGSLGKRELPLSTGFPFMISQTYKLSLPDGKASIVRPGSEKVSSKYGSYSISVKKSGSGFTIMRKASIPFEIIPPEEYPAFVSFLKQVDEAENMTIEVRLK